MAVQIPFDDLQEAIDAGEYTGFCLACGEAQDGVDPDGREDECEACGALQVYGAEEILVMGAYCD